jgi:hypothetical protein
LTGLTVCFIDKYVAIGGYAKNGLMANKEISQQGGGVMKGSN